MTIKNAPDNALPHAENDLLQRLVSCLQDPELVTATILSTANKAPELAADREAVKTKFAFTFAEVVPHLLFDLALPAYSVGSLQIQFDDSTDTRSKRVVENSPNYFDTNDGANRIVLNRWQMLGTTDSGRYKKMPDTSFIPMIVSLLEIYKINIFPQYRCITVAERAAYRADRPSGFIPSAAAPVAQP